MMVKMKVLDRELLLSLNESSVRAGRKQNLSQEQLQGAVRPRYIVNFHFDHNWQDLHDVRLSVILIPGNLTAWLDVSAEEYAAIPETDMPELEWEAAVCVGTPRWVA